MYTQCVCSYQWHVESAHLLLRFFQLVHVIRLLFASFFRPCLVCLALWVCQPFPAVDHSHHRRHIAKIQRL